MPLSYPEIKSFNGLHLQANSFSVPDGAMEVAKNVVISKDNVVQKCRGQYQYYDPSSDTLNQLAVYQDVLLGIFSDKIGYFTDAGSSPNYTGTRTTLSGVTVDITSGRISRYFQSNKNFYAMSDGGLLKLESYSGTVQKAGTPQGLDLRAKFLPATGPIAAEKLVGWRILFGKRDSNDNLLLGAPSEIITLTNSKVTSASWSRSSNVVTVTVSTGHNLATGMSITVSNSSSSDLVTAGSYTVTVTAATTFTISSTDSDVAGPETLDYTVTRSSRLEFTVPSEITSVNEGYFYRIYRSSQVADTATSISSDFKLVEEKALTSGEITAHVVFYNDDIDDILRGTELYTNENSQEGELQANYRPPLAVDVCLYKGFAAYGGVTQRHLLDFQIVDAAVMAAADYVQTMVVIDTAATYTSTGAGPYTVTVTSAAHGLTTGQSIFVDNATDADAEGTFTVTVTSASVFTYSTASGNPLTGTLQFGLVRRYVARTGVGNATVSATSVTAQAVTTDLVVTYASHGLVAGDTVYISNVTGGTLTAGTYYVVAETTNTFEISLTAGGASIDHASETGLDFQGVTDGTYSIFKLDITSSASVQLRDTARGLVKAINRDTSSLIYAAYSSGINEIPGKIRLQNKAFQGAIYLMGNDSTTGGGFNPVIPASFATGTQVYSRNDSLPHVTAFAKFNEPESVPLGNQVLSGASNKQTFRIAPLRDSIIVIKADGVYRITGDSIFNFSSTPLDTTVICVAPDSVAILNNEVYFLSNQGVCRVTESSINIISRKIEDLIQPIVGSSVISAQTSGCAYESERLYLLTTIEPGEATANVTHVYNILSDSWTTWGISTGEFLFKRALVGPSDVLYMVNTSGIVKKERKNQNRIDYCNQNYTATIVSVASNALSAVVTFSASALPVAGDVLELNNVFSRISVASFISGSTYDLTFEVATGLAAADAPTYYEKFDSELKFAPFHAGLVGRMKMFVELQLHFRNNAAGAFEIVFSGDTFGSSEQTDWSSLIIPRGWGDFPWGFEPWGNQDGIDLPLRSGPAPICRLDIPRYQKRGTFIQPTILHKRAGDPINLQAMTWVVRAYNERVSR